MIPLLITAHLAQIENVWRECPAQCTSGFAAVFFQISRAIQARMRETLPARFFNNLEAYEDTRAAFPMLVYACSRPAPYRYRTEFAYDPLDRSFMASFFWSARHTIAARLSETRRFLESRGAFETARAYSPGRAAGILEYVQRHRRSLDGILVAEGALVNELIHMAGHLQNRRTRPGNESQRLLRSWASILRRVYPALRLSDSTFDLFRLATATLVEALSAGEREESSVLAPAA